MGREWNVDMHGLRNRAQRGLRVPLVAIVATLGEEKAMTDPQLPRVEMVEVSTDIWVASWDCRLCEKWFNLEEQPSETVFRQVQHQRARHKRQIHPGLLPELTT